MNLSDLARHLGADLSGNGDIEITGVAGIHEAAEGQVTFIADERRMADLERCRASAVIVPASAAAVGLPALRVRNPRLAFAATLRLFHERPYAGTGISDRAAVGAKARIGEAPSIHPFAVVSDGARIGDRVTLYPGVYIGPGASVGDDTVLHANVTVREGVTVGARVIVHAGTVIGSDGFGFVTDGGRHHKIPQVGGVIIEDDVEIGANAAIDRATLGNTVIKRGTKIDNMVHVAHNVTIGEHCLLAAQTGIAGSTTLGDFVATGGQAGVADHLTIGERTMIGGGAGVTRNVDPGQVVAGYPAIPLRDWLKAQAVLAHLPELKKRIAALERGAIEERTPDHREEQER